MVKNGEKEVFKSLKSHLCTLRDAQQESPSTLERHNKEGDLLIQIYIRAATAYLYIRE